MKRCALYRHFDVNGDLAYVGISVHPGTRLSQHLAGSHWSDQIASVSLEWFESVELAANAERRAIRDEKPAHNKRQVVNLDAPFSTTAQRVIEVRTALDMTQAAFADLIGAKRAQLSNWESGQQRLSLNGALAMHRELGLSLDWLFGLTEARA